MRSDDGRLKSALEELEAVLPNDLEEEREQLQADAIRLVEETIANWDHQRVPVAVVALAMLNAAFLRTTKTNKHMLLTQLYIDLMDES